MRVPVRPALLQWACRRAGVSVDALAERFPKLPEWLRQASQPTFKQLEGFAKATHVPFGYFFLAEPPEEPMPIPDLRTMGGARVREPSADMLDTIYLCQQRQDWYRQHARLMGEEPLAFVGSTPTGTNVVRAAASIRAALGLDAPLNSAARSTVDAFRLLLDRADDLGVMVMVSGIVGNNTRRPLDPEEFRGFALVDPLAPLIFVNGADTKAAQLFTLIHELSHAWSGESGVSDVTTASMPRVETERWCNAVAAEVLAPLADFKTALRPDADLWAETKRLAAVFRVSTLVVLRRMRDAGRLTREQHAAAYGKESARLSALMHARKESGETGGDFYRTAYYRLSTRFASAVIASTWEGRSTFTEAFRLLGCRSVKTLDNLARSIGMGNPTNWEGGPT
jgi:Zn-dependent peptidase ImmA (M78 family)/transcriptional regulator with XRE-family HTH domain